MNPLNYLGWWLLALLIALAALYVAGAEKWI